MQGIVARQWSPGMLCIVLIDGYLYFGIICCFHHRRKNGGGGGQSHITTEQISLLWYGSPSGIPGQILVPVLIVTLEFSSYKTSTLTRGRVCPMSKLMTITHIINLYIFHTYIHTYTL
jgi:hypothetical protein